MDRSDLKRAHADMAPANVVDAALYDRIHAKINEKLAKQDRG